MQSARGSSTFATLKVLAMVRSKVCTWGDTKGRLHKWLRTDVEAGGPIQEVQYFRPTLEQHMNPSLFSPPLSEEDVSSPHSPPGPFSLAAVFLDQ